MKLLSKEKGIIPSILNAIFIIWIVSAIVITVSNVTTILIKDYTYTYDEYKLINCSKDYETEEDCKNNYTFYKLNKKEQNIQYKRNIINSVSNVFIISGVLFLLNKEKKAK